MNEELLMTEEKKVFGRSRVIMCRMTERDKMERARDEFLSDLIRELREKEKKT